MSVKIKEEFISVNGSLTKCDTIKKNVLALIIPGNPGVATYYEEFIKSLNERTGLAIWCVSHAGHVTPLNQESSTSQTKDHLSLKGQIQHKIDFIKDYVPPDVKLILIGHSVGCYMIIHMLETLKERQVLKSALLFPTIERLASTDTGLYMTPFLKYMRWAAPYAISPCTVLSPSIQRSILKWYFKDTNTSLCSIDATLKLVSSESIKHVANMAHDEFQIIKTADYEIIDKHIDKLFVYYGSIDHWCPIQYYEEMKRRYPKADIVLCKDGIQHAFCLDAGSSMAVHVWRWLQPYLKSLDYS